MIRITDKIMSLIKIAPDDVPLKEISCHRLTLLIRINQNNFRSCPALMIKFSSSTVQVASFVIMAGKFSWKSGSSGEKKALSVTCS